MTPVGLAQAWATLLTDAGVRATCNPQDVVPPCILFTPPDTVDMDLGCGGTADLRAMVLVPGPGQFDAWAALDAFMPTVLEHLPVTPRQIRATTYRTDDSGPMPAYELTITAVVDWSTSP